MNIQERVQKQFLLAQKDDKNQPKSNIFTAEKVLIEEEYKEQKDKIDAPIRTYIESIAKKYTYFTEPALYRIFKKADFSVSLAQEQIEVIIQNQLHDDGEWTKVTNHSKHKLTMLRDQQKKQTRDYSPKQIRKNEDYSKRSRSAGRARTSRSRERNYAPKPSKQSVIYVAKDENVSPKQSYKDTSPRDENVSPRHNDRARRERAVYSDGVPRTVYVPKQPRDQHSEKPRDRPRDRSHDQPREPRILYVVKQDVARDTQLPKTPERPTPVVPKVDPKVPEPKPVATEQPRPAEQKESDKKVPDYQMFEPFRPKVVKEVDEVHKKPSPQKHYSPPKAVDKKESNPGKQPAPETKQPVSAIETKVPTPAIETKPPVPTPETKQPAHYVLVIEAKQPVPAPQTKQPVPAPETKQPAPVTETKQPAPVTETKQPVPVFEVKHPAPPEKSNSASEKGEPIQLEPLESHESVDDGKQSGVVPQLKSTKSGEAKKILSQVPQFSNSAKVQNSLPAPQRSNEPVPVPQPAQAPIQYPQQPNQYYTPPPYYPQPYYSQYNQPQYSQYPQQQPYNPAQQPYNSAPVQYPQPIQTNQGPYNQQQPQQPYPQQYQQYAPPVQPYQPQQYPYGPYQLPFSPFPAGMNLNYETLMMYCQANQPVNLLEQPTPQ